MARNRINRQYSTRDKIHDTLIHLQWYARARDHIRISYMLVTSMGNLQLDSVEEKSRDGKGGKK